MQFYCDDNKNAWFLDGDYNPPKSLNHISLKDSSNRKFWLDRGFKINNDNRIYILSDINEKIFFHVRALKQDCKEMWSDLKPDLT